MDVTKSHHPNSMILASAKLEITKSPVTIDRTKKDWSLQQDLLDLGLARGVKISFESSKIDIKADNGTVPIKGLTDVKAKVEFALLERHLPDIAVAMAGLVTVIPNMLKNDVGTMVGKNFSAAFGDTIKLNEEHEVLSAADVTKYWGKEFSVLRVKSKDNWSVVPPDMYTFKKDATKGLRFIQTKGEPLSNGGYDIMVCVITGFQLTKGSGGIAQPIAMKLTNKRKADDGRIITRTFELPYGFYTGDDSITLKSKNDTDNIAEIPMSFEFTPHPDMVDDNELSEMSLYREIAEL